MPEHSEQDLQYAAEFREGIHRDALARVKAVYPEADHVVDEYPVDAYFDEVWEYPGQWNTVVGTPPGTGGRRNLVESIVRNTLAYYQDTQSARSDDAFYRLLEEYPDLVCDYCPVNADNPAAQKNGVFPYRGLASHRLALTSAAETFLQDGDWTYDLSGATCRKLSGAALFAPVNADNFLNYRRAFLCPPHPHTYTDADFDRLNAVLFPGGAEELDVCRWTTDWSDYFDEGHEWWGALCLTVYDRTLDRFVVILAAASD